MFCDVHVVCYDAYDDITSDRQMIEFYPDMIDVYADSSPLDNTYTTFAAPVYLYYYRSILPVQDTHPCHRKYPLKREEN